MSEQRSEPEFLFVGGLLCLDFVNTQVNTSGGPADLLGEFSDLVAWLRQAGVLTDAQAADAVERWGARREGKGALDEARALRAVLRTLAERIAAGQSIQQSSLEAINALLRRGGEYTQVVRARGGFAEEPRREFDRAVDLLVPVAKSAADLLCARDLRLIKKCRNPRCVLYFYDATKNHGRAWCSMNACGNRTKVAAHYRRRRTEGT
jgi:predicted RNA-binding Zn ribbon-like protein